MYFGIFSQKDTTISNLEIDGVSKTGSNSGFSEILELYSLTASVGGRGKSRILLKFDLTELSTSIAAGEIPSSSVEYKLKLKNATHYEKLPSSFIIQVAQLSRSWDEGRGLSMADEELKDSGYANWVNATSLISWDAPGADLILDRQVTQSLDVGDEDLYVDVSDMVGSWLTGGVPNHGFVVKLLDAHETGSVDVYVKKFFSRHSRVPERKPRLEAKWSDFRQDDRTNFYYSVSGSLYYYNTINGQFKNIGPMYVNIFNSSSAVVQTLTASNPDKGIYHASGVLVQHTSSTVIFRDVWFSGTTQYFTGTFSPQFATGSQQFVKKDFTVLLPNLRSEYYNDEEIILRVLGKEKNYKPAVRKSGSVGVDVVAFKDAYYSIYNADTDEVLITFSTGSNKFSKLSYDADGNYFTLKTNLPEGAVYKIKIMVDYDNQRFIFDNNWRFKVRQR